MANQPQIIRKQVTGEQDGFVATVYYSDGTNQITCRQPTPKPVNFRLHADLWRPGK